MIMAYVLGYAQLPKKMEKIEQKAQTLEDSVKGVNNALEKFIAVQHAKEEKDAEHKTLLLELIGKMVK